MNVIRLVLAYDGTDFHGWAAQPGVRTVEGVFAEAIRVVTGSAPKLSVAGRTDAGVHASGQVASFVRPPGTDPASIQRAINGMLAPEIVVRSARVAPRGFEARRRATGREYLYRIDTGPVPDPITARYVWHRPKPLSIARMRAAARPLVGEHDFASFCRAPKVPASTVRNLRRLSVARMGDEVHIRAAADAFLHQMVKSLVGTLVAVGEGKIEPVAIPSMLAARRRSAAGPVAPPHGLTLVRVLYGRPP